MEELLVCLESDIIRETKIFDSDLFLGDSDLENDRTQN